MNNLTHVIIKRFVPFLLALSLLLTAAPISASADPAIDEGIPSEQRTMRATANRETGTTTTAVTTS
jgi:hypothetical protein